MADYATFLRACRAGNLEAVKHLLRVHHDEPDRRIDHIIGLLLSLAGDRAIPGRLLAGYKKKDTPKRLLIAEWACKRARGAPNTRC